MDTARHQNQPGNFFWPAPGLSSLAAWQLKLRKKNPDSPRILIVDDDPSQRSLLNSFLRSQGFDTVTADSGNGRWKRCAPENSA